MKRGAYRENDYSFGQRLLTLRSIIGLTQAGLAEMLGVSRQSVVEWEAGSKYPKAKHLQAFITLAAQHKAFSAGSLEDDIRGLWKGSHQKVLLNEVWLSELLASPPQTAGHRLTPTRSPGVGRFHWEAALAVEAFYGREWELNLLTEWVVRQQCRVVTILGLGGIGKSALAVYLMHEIAEHFEVVIWRSLRDLPTCDALLADLLGVLVPQSSVGIDDPFDERMKLLMEQLRTNRVLLVLDNVESVLKDGELSGQMRAGYEGFGRLLRLCAETHHESSILFTSRQKPDDLLPHEGSQTPVRTLRLVALDAAACEQLLTEREVRGNPAERNQLIQAYAGNPLALKIVARTITDLFDGELRLFLEQGEFIFGGVQMLLAQQFERLSSLEQTLLIWLAILREPSSIHDLASVVSTPVPHGRVMEALQTLYHRSLIERGHAPGTFTLQSVVLEYLAARLIDEANAELLSGQLEWLRQYGLELAASPEYVRQTQRRLIVSPILEHLRAVYLHPARIEAILLESLNRLREMDETAQSYAPANMIALIGRLRGHLRGLDLSQLVLRGVTLQGIAMQDAVLSGVLVRDCVFHETLHSLRYINISQAGDLWIAGDSYQIWLWEDEGRVLKGLWQMGREGIQRFAISPGGQTLVAAHFGNTIRLWDIGSRTVLWVAEHLEQLKQYSEVKISSDGSIIAVAGNDNVVYFLDAADGALIDSIALTDQTHIFAWHPHEPVIAVGDLKGLIHFWSIQPGHSLTFIRTLGAHTKNVPGLAFSPDGNQLASASWDGTVKIWNVDDGSLRETLPSPSKQGLRVAWSADGKTIATSWGGDAIWLWDIGAKRYRTVLRGHTATVAGLSFTPDNRKLVSVSTDSTLRVWDYETGDIIRIIHGYNRTLYVIKWSPDNTRIAAIGSGSEILIFGVHDSTLDTSLPDRTTTSFGLAWSPDGRWIASCNNGNLIYLWDANTGASVGQVAYPDNPNGYFCALAWHPEGRYLAASADPDGMLCLDTETRSFRRFEKSGYYRRLFMEWSRDGQYLAAKGLDDVVYIWDMEGVLLQRIAGEIPIYNFVWAGDEIGLITGHDNGAVIIWDAQTWEPREIFAGDGKRQVALVWHGNGQPLLTSTGTLIRWWDVKTGGCIQELETSPGGDYGFELSPDKTLIAYVGEDSCIYVRDVNSGALIKTLRRDRPYERVNITGIKGLTDAQKTTLRQLGAIEKI